MMDSTRKVYENGCNHTAVGLGNGIVDSRLRSTLCVLVGIARKVSRQGNDTAASKAPVEEKAKMQENMCSTMIYLLTYMWGILQCA
jgi:hypothetical protein